MVLDMVSGQATVPLFEGPVSRERIPTIFLSVIMLINPCALSPDI